MDTILISSFSRICRYTYGEDVNIPFDEDLHDENRKKIIDKKLYCANCFRKFFTIGQQVSLGESVEQQATYSFVDECAKGGRYKPIYSFIYISDKESPMYLDESGCDLLGNIKIECKNDEGVWPEKVSITTKMEITRTEIKVTATMGTGEQVVATFDFL